MPVGGHQDKMVRPHSITTSIPTRPRRVNLEPEHGALARLATRSLTVGHLHTLLHIAFLPGRPDEAHAQQPHQLSEFRGGYLRASLRSLCSRPLALPSAPVTTLGPPSAATRSNAGPRSLSVTPNANHYRDSSITGGQRSHHVRSRGRSTVLVCTTINTTHDLRCENFLYCYQGRDLAAASSGRTLQVFHQVVRERSSAEM